MPVKLGSEGRNQAADDGFPFAAAPLCCPRGALEGFEFNFDANFLQLSLDNLSDRDAVGPASAVQHGEGEALSVFFADAIGANFPTCGVQCCFGGFGVIDISGNIIVVERAGGC